MYLRWDPKEYGGIDILEVPTKDIWLPDIVLFTKWVLHFMTFQIQSSSIDHQVIKMLVSIFAVKYFIAYNLGRRFVSLYINLSLR